MGEFAALVVDVQDIKVLPCVVRHYDGDRYTKLANLIARELLRGGWGIIAGLCLISLSVPWTEGCSRLRLGTTNVKRTPFFTYCITRTRVTSV